MEIEIRQCTLSDLKALQALARQTYKDTFGPSNTPENMRAYVEQAFNDGRLSRELKNPGSTFLFLFADGILAGYMKLNAGDAQTDLTDPEALEIERIYVRAEFQGRGLGAAPRKPAAALARREAS
jgi:GNAT superfamily N-acetyltransferase